MIGPMSNVWGKYISRGCFETLLFFLSLAFSFCFGKRVLSRAKWECETNKQSFVSPCLVEFGVLVCGIECYCSEQL